MTTNLELNLKRFTYANPQHSVMTQKIVTFNNAMVENNHFMYDHVMFMVLCTSEEDQENAEIISCITYINSSDSNNIYIILELATLVSHRKKGYGTTLMERFKDFCIKMNKKGIHLHSVNTKDALSFYASRGFLSKDHLIHGGCDALCATGVEHHLVWNNKKYSGTSSSSSSFL